MDRPEAEKIYASGKEATVLALLQLAAQIKLLRERVDRLKRSAGSSDSPSTPSGMIPPHEKPSASGWRRKQPGRKKGHPGSRRPAIAPEAITHTQEHPLNACPTATARSA